MIDQLKSLGIEKGKPFKPDAATKTLLDAAAREAQALAGGKVRRRLPAVLLARAALDLSGASRAHQGGAGRLRRPQHLSDRRARPRLQLRLYRHQAPGRRPVLPDLHQGQGRRRLRRRQDLSPDRAAERAGRAVLVGDRLRPADARADPQHAARQPLVADPRDAEERRRLDRRLLRPEGAGRQGVELGADRSGAQVRADVPALRADEGAVRQDVEAAGRRASAHQRR